MGILIDTSLWIADERGLLALDSWLAGYREEPVAMSVITVAELLHGVERTTDPRQRVRRLGHVEALLARVPVIEFSVEMARVYARLLATMAARGRPIAAHDLLIAATAITLGWTIATADARSFRHIPGVRVLLWHPG
jgi:predicted nucleic acid-binding protein